MLRIILALVIGLLLGAVGGYTTSNIVDKMPDRQITNEETKVYDGRNGRNVKRLSDIRQISDGLKFIYRDTGRYPIEQTPRVLGETNMCLKEDGWFENCNRTTPGTTYMGSIPKNPLPGGEPYRYQSLDGTTYTLTFMLEDKIGDYAAGPHTATPLGIE